MKRARTVVADAFIAVTLAVIVLATVAVAHTPGPRYPDVWLFDIGAVDYRFKSNFPTGDWRNRVNDGVADWNEVGEPLQFYQAPGDTAGYSRFSCPANYQDSFVQREALDGQNGFIAFTDTCVDVNNTWVLRSFVVTFDDAETWYKRTGVPPGGQYDAWGAATHEFGHATGWSGDQHFSGGAPECVNAPRHTMCPSIGFGQTYWRDLAEHDRHTFQAAY